MSKKETGGPAFPTDEEQSYSAFDDSLDHFEGMTLRDYFAGQALCGLLAKYNLNAPSDQGTIAQMSYELADAMLAERGRE